MPRSCLGTNVDERECEEEDEERGKETEVDGKKARVGEEEDGDDEDEIREYEEENRREILRDTEALNVVVALCTPSLLLVIEASVGTFVQLVQVMLAEA